MKFKQLVLRLLPAIVLAILFWRLSDNDHFAAIPLGNDKSWYLNAHLGSTREIQDRDIFYHNIGQSITNARAADIIVLGHSMVTIGLRYDQMDEFSKRTGVRIFNMSLEGIASGEFARRIIKRWNLKPRLWVINADDTGQSFFSPTMDDFGGFEESSALRIVNTNRLEGYLHVVRRNIEWRLQDLLNLDNVSAIFKSSYPNLPTNQSWRSAITGNVQADRVPEYASHHDGLTVLRDQNCHAGEQEIEAARQYIQQLGAPVVLMLAPHQNWCPMRVREIADAIGAEALIPEDAHDYSTIDGVHMDRNGSIAFTHTFLASLEKSSAFQSIKH